MPCNDVNNTPKTTVKESPVKACSRRPLIIAWWAQVTVAPELSKIAVFNKGTENGFNICIPIGGHKAPNSTAGAKLLWKNAQKKATKKQTSDNININIPIFKPLFTTSVWCPWNVASLITSLHHTTNVVPNIETPNNITQAKL